MTAEMRRGRLLGTVAFLLLWSLVGCSHWVEVKVRPPGSEGVLPAAGRGESHAYMASVKTWSNRVETSPSTDFVRRFARDLEATNAFASVAAEKPPGVGDGHVAFSLMVHEEVQPHTGEAVLKGVFIGLSLFLLTPVLPLRSDFESQMELSAMRPDGQARRYETVCKGTAYFHLFGDAYAAGLQLVAEVTNCNVNSLMNQIVSDCEFYGARR